MARIRKEDHSRILRMVDVEGCKVADIAVEFGCTPAAIYTLLTKLRRAAAEAQRQGQPAQPPLALDDAAPVAELPAPATPSALSATSALSGTSAAATPAAPPGLAATLAAAEPDTAAKPKVVAFERPADVEPRQPRPEAKPAAEASARAAPTPRRSGGGVGAKLAKPGFGLVMRTADGEDTMTPFRSLDDLLSAIKPILRASARSPDPVWFSLQPIDLSTIEMDAA